MDGPSAALAIPELLAALALEAADQFQSYATPGRRQGASAKISI